MPESLQKIYVRVAVALPISGTFTYTVTGEPIDKVAVGKRVLVPFSGRKITAYILRIIPPEKRRGIKDIITVIDAYPLFPPQMVEFFQWLSNYYLYPIGLVIKGALPTGLNVRIPDGTRMPSRGWLDRVGLLKMVFITVKKGATIDRSLFDRGRLPRNEDEFLETMIKKKEISLREIKNAFSNGAYLVDKWVASGFLKKIRRPVARDIADETLFISTKPPPLNSKQKEVVERISEKLQGNAFFTYLLHGITDSGKTEVYYHAVRAAKELGKQSIIMVPEIALTVSMASLFKARFKDRVAILHSALSTGERYDQWIRIAKGDADVVIGARSALFAPLSRLGLIIVDEEHDLSYKQEEKFRYQARDAAIVRAKLSDAVVILGSGTPSVQSYQNAAIGKYGFLTMPKRIRKRELPDIKVIDMMAKFERSSAAQDESIMSPPLKEAIEENLTRKKQTILFLNRRGFSSLYLCRFCGETIRCPNCEVSLTYHKYGGNLLCHYCGFSIKPPNRCPACNLVGVISADLSLNYPDFRAGEVTFQLLSQVAGRTGRGSVPGKVIIQTFNPSHYAISATKDHNYERFFSQEIALRRQVNYPPFSLIANVRFLGNSKSKTEKIATHIGMKIRNTIKKQSKRKNAVEILGPVEAPMAKLKGKYRQQILIKSRTSRYLNQLLKDVETFSTQTLSSSGVRMIIDVDPYQMM
jgi:primosomal protein N' (replication factor Y)